MKNRLKRKQLIKGIESRDIIIRLMAKTGLLWSDITQIYVDKLEKVLERVKVLYNNYVEGNDDDLKYFIAWLDEEMGFGT